MGSESQVLTLFWKVRSLKGVSTLEGVQCSLFNLFQGFLFLNMHSVGADKSLLTQIEYLLYSKTVCQLVSIA